MPTFTGLRNREFCRVPFFLYATRLICNPTKLLGHFGLCPNGSKRARHELPRVGQWSGIARTLMIRPGIRAKEESKVKLAFR
jgi:hypothetical protein